MTAESAPHGALQSGLLLKLLAVIALVVAVVSAIVWLSVDYFALRYFTDLLDTYQVPKKDEVIDMFLSSAHRGLAWGALLSLAGGLAVGFGLIRMVLGPLYQMIRITRRISAGDFSARAPVSAQDEVGELGRAFNAMTNNLQRIEDLRKRMVVDIAHELRSPLTNIRGYLEALSTGVMEPTQQTIEALHDETRRLSNLTEDLMRLSAADAARLTLRRTSADPRLTLMQTLQLFKTHFADKDITVEPPAEGATGEIAVDVEKLQQIFQNVLDNAWRYTPRGGRLKIAIERASRGIRVTLANTGDPIAQEHLPLMFERFYRLDAARSRESGGGAGIGLSIVKELVEAHGGEVRAESAAGENRIWFTLPG